MNTTTAADITLGLFGGPGGWAEGAGRLGLREVGVEFDTSACRTRRAAGHTTVQADVAALPVEPMVGRVRGLVASPPCQPFSNAGKRLGLADQALVHQAVHDLSLGRDTRTSLLTACKDPRSLLAAEPMRYLHAIRPEWVALEEVPAVLPLFRHYAEILRGWGYSVWCGVLNTADYGVPQSRRRAILLASVARQVSAPEATHSEVQQPYLFGRPLLPWVTMAAGLGWMPGRATGLVTASDERSPISRAAVQAAINDPAHWAWHRPAPTVSGTVGHVGGKQSQGHLSLNTAEGARLQSFPDGYRFHGGQEQVSLQIGNAVPPRFAAHVLSVATGIPLTVPAATAA